MHAFAAAPLVFAALVTPVAAQETFAIGETVDARLVGVWESLGYGRVLEITPDGRFDVHDVTPSWCAYDAEISMIARALLDRARLTDDGRTLELMTRFDDYPLTFRRTGSLPPSCGMPVDASPTRVVDVLAELFSIHYAFFDERGVDWPSQVAAARARVDDDVDDAELFEILTEMLAPIDDGHVSLMAVVDGRERFFSPGLGDIDRTLRAQAERNGESPERLWSRRVTQAWRVDVPQRIAKGGSRQLAQGQLLLGLVDEHIGYLGVRSMGGYTEDGDESDAAEIAALDAALDTAFSVLSQMDAVIVDVTLNQGGMDVLGRRIAERFTAERTLAYTKHAADAPTAEPFDVYVDPARGARFEGPVWLVTSGITVSAAETFAMAMRALPNVTHVGTTTAGALSDMLRKTLPNGWRVTLSNEVYRDHTGVCWEARGIPPEVEIPIFDERDVFEGHVEAIDQVVEHIRAARDG